MREVRILADERGMALILALFLLMVLGLLGSLGMTLVSNELGGAGGSKLAEMRFYEAQAGLDEALQVPGEWLKDDFLGADPPEAQKPYPASTANVEIRFIQDEDPAVAEELGLPLQPHFGEPPEGSGYGMGAFQVRRFCVTATTPDERGQVRAGVWRVFHK